MDIAQNIGEILGKRWAGLGFMVHAGQWAGNRGKNFCIGRWGWEWGNKYWASTDEKSILSFGPPPTAERVLAEGSPISFNTPRYFRTLYFDNFALIFWTNCNKF